MSGIERVCIVGAGAIGSLYAGHLGSIVEVAVQTRRQVQADLLNRDGLRVTGKSDRQVRVHASTKPHELGEPDLVIVATKIFDVERCVEHLQGYYPRALMMMAQNGLGCEKIAARYGDWPILSAVTFMAGTRHSDIHVEYELDTPTWLGPWAGSGASLPDAQRVAHLLNEAGLKAEAFEDLLPAQWSKLIFNATINSISALTDLGFCQRFVEREQVTDLGHLVYDVMQEGKRVAAACGVILHQDPWDMVVQAARQYHTETGGDRIPSMLADVRAQRQTEVDWIIGALVREAVKAGVPTPLNHTLYRLIRGREMSWKSSIVRPPSEGPSGR